MNRNTTLEEISKQVFLDHESRAALMLQKCVLLSSLMNATVRKDSTHNVFMFMIVVFFFMTVNLG